MEVGIRHIVDNTTTDLGYFSTSRVIQHEHSFSGSGVPATTIATYV